MCLAIKSWNIDPLVKSTALAKPRSLSAVFLPRISATLPINCFCGKYPVFIRRDLHDWNIDHIVNVLPLRSRDRLLKLWNLVDFGLFAMTRISTILPMKRFRGQSKVFSYETSTTGTSTTLSMYSTTGAGAPLSITRTRLDTLHNHKRNLHAKIRAVEEPMHWRHAFDHKSRLHRLLPNHAPHRGRRRLGGPPRAPPTPRPRPRRPLLPPPSWSWPSSVPVGLCVVTTRPRPLRRSSVRAEATDGAVSASSATRSPACSPSAMSSLGGPDKTMGNAKRATPVARHSTSCSPVNRLHGLFGCVPPRSTECGCVGLGA